MRIRLKFWFFVFTASLILFSCDSADNSKKMFSIKVNILVDRPLVEDENESLPAFIKKILWPIECEEVDTVFVPQVFIFRSDLPEEEHYFEVPKELANSLRSKFGTYTYGNLKADYENFIPGMKAGNYLSKESEGFFPDSSFCATDGFLHGNGDFVFEISESENLEAQVDSILLKLKEDLCSFAISENVNLCIILRPEEILEHDTAQVVDNLNLGLAKEIQTKTEVIIEKETDKESRYQKLKEIYIFYVSDDTRSQLLDYWAYYQLAINRLLGDATKESLACLEKAAKLAIESGDGKILLGRILDDAKIEESEVPNEKDRKAWRLMQFKEWEKIKKALERNDKSLLKHHHLSRKPKRKKPVISIDTTKADKDH